MKPGRKKSETEDIRRAAHQWRAVLSEGVASDADKRAFETWLRADARHEDAFDRAETVWSALGGLGGDDMPPEVLRPGLHERIVAVFRSISPLRFFSRPLAIGLGASAATCALMIAVYVFGLNSERAVGTEPVAHATARGELKTIALADGTQAQLGAATRLEIKFTDDRRRVRLISGAAYFDIASDPSRPFAVAAGDLIATAVGTEFDVRNNGGVARVGVAEGAVEVSFPFVFDGEATTMRARARLEAGQEVAASHQDGLDEVRTARPKSIGAWRDSRLIYVGAPLSELAADASRYSETPITIEDEAIAALKATVSFDATEIDAMLLTLADIFPIEVDRSSPERIRLRARAAHAE